MNKRHWKAIRDKSDDSGVEYFNECFNTITDDISQIKNLLKNKILVTTLVIRNFHLTIQ